MCERLKIEDLKNMGDSSFSKMQEQARESAGGDADKEMNILTEMVLHDFLSRMMNKKATANISETESDVHSSEPDTPNIMCKVRKPRHFKTSEIDKVKTIPRDLPIGHTKKKLSKEKELAEKDSQKIGIKKRVCSWSVKGERRTSKRPMTSNVETVEAQQELPDQIKSRIREMNGTEPKLLIQKKVKKTDLQSHQKRFAIPKGELKTTEFLTGEEHMIVDGQLASVEVTLLDPVLREFKVRFKRWDMGKSFTYNLTTGWAEFLMKNMEDVVLRVDDLVQIWYFQRDSKTCLAMVNLTRGAREPVACSSSGIGRDGEGTSSGGAALATQEAHE